MSQRGRRRSRSKSEKPVRVRGRSQKSWDTYKRRGEQRPPAGHPMELKETVAEEGTWKTSHTSPTLLEFT